MSTYSLTGSINKGIAVEPVKDNSDEWDRNNNNTNNDLLLSTGFNRGPERTDVKTKSAQVRALSHNGEGYGIKGITRRGTMK